MLAELGDVVVGRFICPGSNEAFNDPLEHFLRSFLWRTVWRVKGALTLVASDGDVGRTALQVDELLVEFALVRELLAST